jgi:hypothetical protein
MIKRLNRTRSLEVGLEGLEQSCQEVSNWLSSSFSGILKALVKDKQHLQQYSKVAESQLLLLPPETNN